MKRNIFLILIILLLVACTPKESPDDMPDLDYEMSDEVTRPIPPSVDVADIESQYHQRVLDTIYACFRSFLEETDDPNEFISHKGTRIRLGDPDRLKNSERLSDADKANGVVWEGKTKIEIIYFDDSTGLWKDRKLFSDTYQFHENGRLTRYDWRGSQDFVDFQCWEQLIP